jgi:serine/threonine protein kinase
MINHKGHDGRVDIWCIGVLLFELITGKIPFQGKDIDTLKYNIRNMRICWPSEINSEAKDLIGKILKYNPEDRLNVKEILGHSFIKKYFPNAVNELILPNERLKYNVFVVSVDDPKKWNPLIIDEETNSYNKCFPSNNEKELKELIL